MFCNNHNSSESSDRKCFVKTKPEILAGLQLGVLRIIELTE